MSKRISKEMTKAVSKKAQKKELAKKDDNLSQLLNKDVYLKVNEDLGIIEATFKKEPAIESVLTKMLTDRLSEPYDSIHTKASIKDSFRYCFNERAGNLLYGLITVHPEQSAELLKKCKVSQKVQNWVKTCFILFGPKLARLEALETNPNDWNKNNIDVFYDINHKPWAKLSITKVNGEKFEVISEYNSIFRLMLGLLGNLFDKIPDNHDIPKEKIDNFYEIVKTFHKQMQESSH